MSIQINNINAIDDDRNFSAAGIVTVGTGNSATIIDGTTGITSVGIGITMEGVPGNISIAGTLTAAGFNIPANIVSFSPANGATNVAVTTSIVLTFDQAVGVATTGTILLKEGSAGGSTIQTLGVSNIQSIPNGIIIRTNESLGYTTSIYPIIPEGFIKSTSGDFIGLNTTGADSYSFETGAFPALGAAAEGGYIICKSGGTAWIVAPSSAEVSATWYNRSSAVTAANANAACGDWFVPSAAQLQNPGSVCRTYWDSYANAYYFSNQTGGIGEACVVQISNGSLSCRSQSSVCCVRAFRTVSY